ncbi:uncharacterized protein DDB_G0287625-like [Symsagittifera roscoffensis]|uniref:uncharacterized protein DDB_G0287625-like n=1 Tax=Symsagittifera roscoffensis TaxID=84072 RepID=UPI00307B5CB5
MENYGQDAANKLATFWRGISTAKSSFLQTTNNNGANSNVNDLSSSPGNTRGGGGVNQPPSSSNSSRSNSFLAPNQDSASFQSSTQSNVNNIRPSYTSVSNTNPNYNSTGNSSSYHQPTEDSSLNRPNNLSSSTNQNVNDSSSTSPSLLSRRLQQAVHANSSSTTMNSRLDSAFAKFVQQAKNASSSSPTVPPVTEDKTGPSRGANHPSLSPSSSVSVNPTANLIRRGEDYGACSIAANTNSNQASASGSNNLACYNPGSSNVMVSPSDFNGDNPHHHKSSQPQDPTREQADLTGDHMHSHEPNRSPRTDQLNPSQSCPSTPFPDQHTQKPNSVLNVATSLFTRSPRLPHFRNLRSETIAVDSNNPDAQPITPIVVQQGLDSIPTPTSSKRASVSNSPSQARLSEASLPQLNPLPEENLPEGLSPPNPSEVDLEASANSTTSRGKTAMMNARYFAKLLKKQNTEPNGEVAGFHKGSMASLPPMNEEGKDGRYSSNAIICARKRDEVR